MAELSDKEITEACARATKVWETAHEWYPTMTLDSTFTGIRTVGEKVYLVPRNPFRQDPQLYDPLHDDAQAMALMKKLGMMIEPDGVPTTEWTAHCWHQSKIAWRYVSDTDLNRAICLCAARVQIEKEKNA